MEAWNWYGPLQIEGTGEKKHDHDLFAIAVLEKDFLSVFASDSAQSYVGKVQLCASTSDDLAPVAPKSRRRLIQQAFGNIGIKPDKVRFLHSPMDVAKLRISARWGVEFEQYAFDLDFLSVDLHLQPNSEAFLQTAFGHIAKARQQLEQLGNKTKQLQFQYEDSSDALQRINHANTVMRRQRICIFMNALNKHKRKIAENSHSP